MTGRPKGADAMDPTVPPPEDTGDAESMCTWLTGRVAAYLGKSPADLDPRLPLAEYGLDSVYAVSLSGDIEAHLGVEVEPTLAWDYPTIDAIARYLCDEVLGGSRT
jgi:acyl carrier protein